MGKQHFRPLISVLIKCGAITTCAVIALVVFAKVTDLALIAYKDGGVAAFRYFKSSVYQFVVLGTFLFVFLLVVLRMPKSILRVLRKRADVTEKGLSLCDGTAPKKQH
jgi:hypothetical protein